MQNNILHLETSSPEELKIKLEDNLEAKGSFINLSIFGPKVVVRQVELPVISKRDLGKALKLEAAELLSLSPNEVELKYQILNSTPDKVSCVFVAIPREQLSQYCKEIAIAGAKPLCITAKMLDAINSSLANVPVDVQSFSLINFPGTWSAYLILCSSGNCELLREINFESIPEAHREISKTLKYALSKSANKETPELYFTGELNEKKTLVEALESEFDLKSKRIDLISEEGSPASDTKKSFNINLIDAYSVSLPARKKLDFLVNMLLIAALIGFAVLFAGYMKLESQVSSLKKDFSPTKTLKDYTNKIKDLQSKIRLLENEK